MAEAMLTVVKNILLIDLMNRQTKRSLISTC